MSKTKQRLAVIIAQCEELFGDTKEDRREQLEALEEIASHCESSAGALRDDFDPDLAE